MNEERNMTNPMREANFANAKLIRQASADAAFLRNLSQKTGNRKEDQEELSPFSYIRSQSVSHQHQQEYAMYRQKYLIMYSPFKENQSGKEKTNKWFNFMLNKWKEKKEKPIPSTSSRACLFVRLFRRDTHRVKKSSAVTPVSSTHAL